MSKQDGSNRHVTIGEVDDRTATILHVDMDAFFASVELLEHPEHRGKPVIVAHDSARSVVTAATYEARKFGVNSAMPLSLAKRRCPNAIILPPQFERYQHFSRIIMRLCEELTPYVERLGIDEAFLDVAGATKAIGTPVEVAGLLRTKVFAETGLRCSVGAASTKFVAKLASSRAKPDGVLVVPHADTVSFLHPLPVGALWGVGATTEAVLRGENIHTIGAVAVATRETLEKLVGVAGAVKLHNLSWGIDPRHVQPPAEEKSIGHEMTFETDVTDPEQIRREILRLAGMVAVRLRRAGLEGRTVALKLRFGDFSTISRSHTLTDPTDLGRTIYEEARALYAAVGRESASIRLVGVRAEQLIPAGSGATALWSDSENWSNAEEVMDAVAERFGSGLVKPASLIRPSSATRVKPSQPEAGTR